MEPIKQVYCAFIVVLFGVITNKIIHTMSLETLLVIILAVALAISLWFNWRLYGWVKAYQKAFADMTRKQILFIIGAGVAGLLWGKIIADRIAGREE